MATAAESQPCEAWMEEWVLRALQRWPNVPALYGWLTLDRRGHWLIKGEIIGRTQIVDVINRNYAVDDRGSWYFQNGPQRGYMQLERAPFIVHFTATGAKLRTHTQLEVNSPSAIFMDENGGLFLQTEHGPAALLDADLEFALARMTEHGAPVDEQRLTATLALESGLESQIRFSFGQVSLPVIRLDAAEAPQRLGFVCNPLPIV